MLDKLQIPRGVYADALPTGEFVHGQMNASFTTTHLMTHRGAVPIPVQAADAPGYRLLHNRLTMVNGLQIVSQGHNDNALFHYHDSAWHVTPPVNGTQGACFGPDGRLYRIEPGPNQPSSGIAYVDVGGPVYGHETYDPTTPLSLARGVKRLYAWTERDGIFVGQGDKGGCVIQYQGKHYLLVPGDTQFVQFHKAGDKLAIAMTRFWERDVFLCWLNVADIVTLPIYPTGVVVVPPPPPPPPPPIDPPVDPEVPVQLPDDVFATLQALRPKYPTPLGDQGAALLNEVAWTHRSDGWGLEAKPGGFTCPQPKTGTRCGCDILRTIDKGWDVLADAEGEGKPQQAESGPAEPSRFVAPVKPSGVVDPPPIDPPPVDPPPVDPPPPTSELEARVTALEAAVKALTATDTALATRINDLEDAPIPPPAEGNFHPDDWVVSTPVRLFGMQNTFTGTIKAKT